MFKSRQLHLWIGLVTSVIILVEAVTGLLLLEPKLMGVERPAHEQRQQLEQATNGESSSSVEAQEERVVVGKHFEGGGQGSGVMGFVKNLHAGRIGNTDVSILMEIMAIGLIILTITGITMSLRILKAQRRGRSSRM